MSAQIGEDPRAVRAVLSRHPVAVETVLVASGLVGCDCELVAFEDGRAFVVASSNEMVLQPRSLFPVEARLLEEGGGAASTGGKTAVGLKGPGGEIVGSMTLLGQAESFQIDGLHALCRLVAREFPNAVDAEDSVHEAILDGLRDVVVVLEPDFTVRWVNRAVGSLLGRTKSSLVGRSAMELLHPDDVVPALDAMARLTTGLEVFRVFVRVERGGGGFERVEITGVDQTKHPSLGGVVLSLRGAEVAEELEASVERTNRISDAILAGLHDGIVATDQFGAVTVVNDVAREMFGLARHAPSSSLDLADFALIDKDGRVVDHRDLTALGSFEKSSEVCVVSPGGDPRYVTCSGRQVHADNGDLLGTVLSFHDVTEAHLAADELRRQALHDQLTGLANRRQLETRLSELALGNSASQVAACFIDLDSFKLVNDTHGHRVGDEIIRIAADRLRSFMGSSDLLVRQGGDEFVALLVDTGGREDPAATAERIRVALSQPYLLSNIRFDLTTSIGVSVANPAQLGDDSLLRQADIALYAAKARGRNRVEKFDDDLAAAVQLEEGQRRMIRAALDSDQLTVHFQPLLDSNSSTTVGYEALARICDVDGKLHSPAGFLAPIFDSGLMWEIDQAAFTQSCQAARVLAKVTPEHPPIVACNFSPISLLQSDFVDFVVSTIRESGISPPQICIEITESSAFDAGPASRDALIYLAEHGCLLALDDFGTGYSSLSHLRELPLTSVKVDRSFIARLTEPSTERAIADAVVGLANDLGLEVVAEGVETQDQLREVQELGFGTVQGWHYATAMTLDDVLTRWITRDTSSSREHGEHTGAFAPGPGECPGRIIRDERTQ